MGEHTTGKYQAVANIPGIFKDAGDIWWKYPFNPVRCQLLRRAHAVRPYGRQGGLGMICGRSMLRAFIFGR